jgi:hypothetical protein
MGQLTDRDYATEARRYSDMADKAMRRGQYALVARYTMLAQELASKAIRARHDRELSNSVH